MDKQNNYGDQIDAYLLDKLKGEELKKFEEVMNSNNDIKMEVRIKRELKESFELEDAFKLKERLKSFSPNAVEETPVIPLNQKSNNWLKYAAAIAIFACALFGLKQAGILNPANTQDQFAANYDTYPFDIGERGTMSPDIKQLKELYIAENYSDAIPVLNTLITGDDRIQWALYRGVSFLETGNISSAIVDFKEVANSSDENWNDHGRWYLAMAYLKSENISAAKKELKILAQKESADHREEAQRLLKEL